MDDELREKRRKVLGASDVAGVLGISKFINPLDVYISKVDGVDNQGNMATGLGHRLQPAIAAEAKDRYGLKLLDTEVFGVSPDEPWAGATLDYLAEEDGEKIALEIKATSDYSWPEIPQMYQTQLAWQCFVHGLDRAKLVALHASTKIEVYEFNYQANALWIADILEYCKGWWFRHVEPKIPPPAQFSDLLARGLIRAEPGKKQQLALETVGRISRVERAKALISRLEALVEDAELSVKEELGSAEEGHFDGKTVVTWKEQRQKRLDSTKLKAEMPEIFAKYQMETVSRRFLIKKGVANACGHTIGQIQGKSDSGNY